MNIPNFSPIFFLHIPSPCHTSYHVFKIIIVIYLLIIFFYFLMIEQIIKQREQRGYILSYNLFSECIKVVISCNNFI